MSKEERDMAELMVKLFKGDGLFGMFLWDPTLNDGYGDEVIHLCFLGAGGIVYDC